MGAREAYRAALFVATAWVGLVLIGPGIVHQSYAQGTVPPGDLPLLTLDDLQYVGAFRLPAATYGASSLNYSEGPLAYNAAHHSIFIVGHSHHQAVAEFGIPSLVQSADLADLHMAGGPLQGFTTILDRAAGGNPQDMNRIGGMAVIDAPGGSALLINAYEYYDAPGDNTHATFVVRDPNNLAGTAVSGFMPYEGGAGHTSGWISPIPSLWQAIVGGTHLTGQSSGIPIISRTSVGPSAFVFDPLPVIDPSAGSTPVPTTRLLDFSLQHPLHEDLSNTSRANDLWTHLSRATYGILVPGTRTYATFGYSGGHRSGVCYKCTQNDGTLCGGYCAPDAGDYDQFYWFWDMNDLVAVKEGRLDASSVRPYSYGAFPTPFQNETRELGGGAFDPATGILYLTVQKADRDQGTYANPPVVVAYRFNGVSVAVEEERLRRREAAVLTPAYPNPFHQDTRLHLTVPHRQHVNASVYDLLGRRVAVLFDGVLSAGEPIILQVKAASLPNGPYLVRVAGETFDAYQHVMRIR